MVFILMSCNSHTERIRGNVSIVLWIALLDLKHKAAFSAC